MKTFIVVLSGAALKKNLSGGCQDKKNSPGVPTDSGQALPWLSRCRRMKCRPRLIAANYVGFIKRSRLFLRWVLQRASRSQRSEWQNCMSKNDKTNAIPFKQLIKVSRLFSKWDGCSVTVNWPIITLKAYHLHKTTCTLKHWPGGVWRCHTEKVPVWKSVFGLYNLNFLNLNCVATP